MEAPPSLDHERRIVALEERTRPKPKSLVEHIKDWGGVATFCIALLYSFPLGLWDRFITTPTEELRSLSVRLAQIDSDMARSYSAITNDELRAMYGRAMSSQKYALLAKHIGDQNDILRYSGGLSAPEVILLAYNIGLTGDVGFSERLYDIALTKSDRNLSLQADIHRLKAHLYFSSPDRAKLKEARLHYSNSVGMLVAVPVPNFRLQATNNAFEWAVMELSAGDWECGQKLSQWAIEEVKKIPLISPEIATYRRQYEEKIKQFTRGDDQPQLGCQQELVQWIS